MEIKAKEESEMGTKRNLISIQSAYWYDDDRPDDSIRFIKSCGFEAIDFSLEGYFKKTFDETTLTSAYDRGIDAVVDHYRPLKKALQENGVKISMSHAPYPIYFPDNKEKSSYLISVVGKMIAVCEFLECPAIVVHANYSNDGEDLKKEQEIIINNFIRFIPAAKKHGITVCLENAMRAFNGYIYEGTCTDAVEACYYVDTLNDIAGEKLFGFCFDTGHALAASRDLYRYVTTLGSRLINIHIHENNGTKDSHLIPYTQKDSSGYQPVADWDRFLKGLKQIGYSGPINFETFLGYKSFPEDVRPAVFRLLCDIGKYFRKTINE